MYQQIRDFHPLTSNCFDDLSRVSGVLDLPDRALSLMNRLKSLSFSKKLVLDSMTVSFRVDGARPRDKMKDAILVKHHSGMTVYIVYVRGPKCGVYHFEDKFTKSQSAGPDGQDHWSTVLKFFMEDDV